jgi:molybdopterin synthase sulfur carrier subunit
MAVKVRIPTPLQKLTAHQGEVTVEAKNVNQLLGELEARYPGVQERLCDADGKLRRFVNIYVNEEDIRFLQGQETALKDGDDVSIIPAIAGGAGSKRVTRRVMLVFPPNLIREPVVFTMAKKFDVTPNIRRARVTETIGEMTLELEGAIADLERGIAYLESRGVKVEPVAGESAL